MGAVSFNTDIFKEVLIDVDVDFIKNAEVNSTVDIDDKLATAEASADATGAGEGNGGDGPLVRTFLIDEFSDFQDLEIAATVTVPTTISGLTTLTPGTETDLAAPDENTRYEFIDASRGPVDFDSPVIQDGADFGRINIGAATNATVQLVYGSDGSGGTNGTTSDLTVGGGEELVVVGEADFPSADPEFQLRVVLTDGGADPDGEQSAEVILPVAFGGVVGDFEVRTALSAFTDANPLLDLTDIDTIEVNVEDDGADPGLPQYDILLDYIAIEGREPGEGGEFAETETFAQVSELGAFAFSQSVAASSPFETDADLL